jgi:leucyl aminopeptidase
MTPRRIALTLSIIVLAAGASSRAATPASAQPLRATPAHAQEDPFEPVFIVTSRDIYRRFVRIHARSGADRVDSSGHALVLAELRAHQLADIDRAIHGEEHRCGGYFAFATRAQAEAFIRSDRSRQALQASAAAAYAMDQEDTVTDWLPQVSEDEIHATIEHLSTDFPNRYYASNYGRAAALSIRDNWLALAAGRSDVSAELFTDCYNCSTQPSVILTIQGSDLADEVVVLGGHLDSISGSGSGDGMDAPGADDDASGIATLTEVLRVAMANGWKPRRTVKFMGYAAEEVGLRGSHAIANAFAAQGVDVHGVLQLDMTNYKSGPVEDMQLITDYSNPDLQSFMTALFDTYLAPLGLTRGTYTCGYGCSDHASWTSAGFASGMMFEAGDPNGDFPYIHSPYDTLANMGDSAQHSVKFAQFGLAFLAEMAKSAQTGIVVPRLPDCDGRVPQDPSLTLAPAARFLQSPVPGARR